jgi:hypothetical protein
MTASYEGDGGEEVNQEPKVASRSTPSRKDKKMNFIRGAPASSDNSAGWQNNVLIVWLAGTEGRSGPLEFVGFERTIASPRRFEEGVFAFRGCSPVEMQEAAEA